MSRIPPEFKVIVPPDRTALYPARRRDESRLLVVDRERGGVIHVGRFRDVVDFIAGDLLVLNDTRVVPARVIGRKPSGGEVELLFLVTTSPEFSLPEHTATPSSALQIRALIAPSRRLRPGIKVELPHGASYLLECKSLEGGWEGVWEGESGVSFAPWLERAGTTPLPPYIRRPVEHLDRERYQTVYAHHPGSVAAPTAGLHFTDELLRRLEAAGTEIARLTLDVGWGTFEPIRDSNITRHRMHSERYDIPPETQRSVSRAMDSGRRITAVGTTTVRALEDAAAHGLPLPSGEEVAEIFIHPPYCCRVVDALITNFHRPDSTLLQLVAALTGWELLNVAYQRALDEGFRFYSYGDAMLIR